MAQQLRTPTTVAETLSLFLCTRGLQLTLTLQRVPDSPEWENGQQYTRGMHMPNTHPTPPPPT